MKAGEHQEDKEGECFVRFGHGGGLTPSGITVKVRTCEERKRFGIRVGKVYTSAQSLKTYSNSPCPQEWMSLVWYDN